ncbi:recombinase family protein [Catenulispora pinisilvae]|uniref:recombinase family protein n=1 Tax=Catenulispora pinisilvae TaxID=2705253 RepID=UPI0018918220|nr:recombinase family protein [Catenulispora pinisilvae]
MREPNSAVGIYCCVPHIDDDDQSTVDVRELRCREYARALRLTVAPSAVQADAVRTVWKAKGVKPGWIATLAAVERRKVDDLILYAPGSLLRHRAHDLVRLLNACERNGIRLHSVGDEWNLADPAQRRTMTDRASAAWRSAQAVSRASRAAHRGAALAGRPHGGGRRAFGYESGMGAVVPAESKVVREVFSRFLEGETLRAIAFDLNDRNVPTALGSAWTVGGVGRILDAPRYAGIRVFRGQVRADDGGYLLGAWEPCISVEEWERVRTLRADHAPRSNGARNGSERSGYLLTGLVECMACGHSMVGSVVGGYRMYACASTRNRPPEECARSIGATSFEVHVQQDAVRILQEWDADRVAALPMVGNRRPEVRPGDVEHAAFGDIHGGVVVRSASAVDGIVTGPDAGLDWPRVPLRRRAEVLRFLYTVIRVGPKTTSRGVFDPGRIALVPHPL